MIKIAYQGVEGSNSQEAAISLASSYGIQEYELIPMISSIGVVEALKTRKAHYGVMASYNHIVGWVIESEEALRNYNYRVVQACTNPIHHYLYSLKDEKPKRIASHIQALKQCKNNLKTLYPECELIEVEDTALAAKYLAEGKLDKDTAVLCHQKAGEMYGLHLLKANLEDGKTNATDFIMIKERMKIVVAGLGLIGGSMAKALKKYTDHEIYGYNRNIEICNLALKEKAIDANASDEIITECDILMPVMYPQATIDFLKEKMPLMKKDALIVDLVGVKQKIIEEIEPLALKFNLHFVGGHPMAGLAKAGYERSFPELYQNANMILVPTKASNDDDINFLSDLFTIVGFKNIKICDASTHDKMIAHTSQLAHIVSNSYVKSPASLDYQGYTGGSYQDMTRISCLNEEVWQELFIFNKEMLVPEIEALISRMNVLKDAIEKEEYETLKEELKQGRLAKEKIDELNGKFE